MARSTQQHRSKYDVSMKTLYILSRAKNRQLSYQPSAAEHYVID